MENLLTRKQIEVLEMLKDGLSEDDIADKKMVDLESIRKCLYRVRKRLNVKNSKEMIEVYMEGTQWGVG